ncbi:hypothetical protein L6452_21970 [Arctium lappa]|uniref:Uncharacterized protein n=1 Tax=Arctium lappa TaxID=4217 RepID=A0ACB9AXY1_ARCLA|nr:hypothetical protein L6452_21970 [Arctium lappa]
MISAYNRCYELFVLSSQNGNTYPTFYQFGQLFSRTLGAYIIVFLRYYSAIVSLMAAKKISNIRVPDDSSLRSNIFIVG